MNRSLLATGLKAVLVATTLSAAAAVAGDPAAHHWTYSGPTGPENVSRRTKGRLPESCRRSGYTLNCPTIVFKPAARSARSCVLALKLPTPAAVSVTA